MALVKTMDASEDQIRDKAIVAARLVTLMIDS